MEKENLREMRLRERGPDRFDTVFLRGDCDLHSAPNMRKAVMQRIGLGTRKLRPDSFGVSYLDSTGVGAIIKNAVKHGNKSDPSKKIMIWYAPRRRVRLIVEDEGEGFSELDEWSDGLRTYRTRSVVLV